MATERPHSKEQSIPWQAVRGEHRLEPPRDYVCPKCRIIIYSEVSGRNICQHCGAIVGSDPAPTAKSDYQRNLAWCRFLKVKDVRHRGPRWSHR